MAYMVKGESYEALPARVYRVNDYQTLLLINQGQHRQVRGMFETLGNPVTDLHRWLSGQLIKKVKLILKHCFSKCLKIKFTHGYGNFKTVVFDRSRVHFKDFAYTISPRCMLTLRPGIPCLTSCCLKLRLNLYSSFSVSTICLVHCTCSVTSVRDTKMFSIIKRRVCHRTDLVHFLWV